jgi:phenylacetate-CoA ligase
MILKILLEKKHVMKMNAKTLQKYYLRKLNKIVCFACKNSPYYNELINKTNIKKIRSLKDFGKIPFLTKQIIRENFEKIRVPKIKGYKVRSTGSSGEPLEIYKNKNSIYRTLLMGNPVFIAKYLNLSLNNILLLLLNDEHSIENILTNPLDKFLKVQKFLITVDKDIEYITKFIYEKNIEFIITYPHMLKNIANEAKNKNIKFPNLKLVLISGELITDNFVHKYEEFFNCFIMNSYISTEGGLMAVFLPQVNGMKIVYDNVYIETIDEEGKSVFNKEGRIVITDLNNKAFPLIRYSGLKDKGIITFDNKQRPILKVILGREMDEIVNSAQRHFSSYIFTDILESVPNINKFQIHQLDHDRFKILIEAGKDLENIDEIQGEIKIRFEEVLKEKIELKIEPVDEIETENQMFYVVKNHFL